MKTKYFVKGSKEIKVIIRKAIENKRYWVIEIYFNDKQYPNIITGRYKNQKEANLNVKNYLQFNEFISWGNY